MSQWTIYHNPRCSKSRETLAILQNEGIEPTIVEYLKTPPDAQTLRTLLKKLGMPASSLIRNKEPSFKELDLDLSDEKAVVAALASHPELIERPIVVKSDRAVLGRPPENVKKLIE